MHAGFTGQFLTKPSSPCLDSESKPNNGPDGRALFYRSSVFSGYWANKADKLVSITSSDNVSLDIKLYLSLEELLSYSVEIGKVSSSNNNVS